MLPAPGSSPTLASTRQPSAFACSGGECPEHRFMEREIQKSGRRVLRDMADRQAARLRNRRLRSDRASPAMQWRSVDFPRPLAATTPMRSPALRVRFSPEKSKLRQRNAEIADIDEGHLRSLVFWRRDPSGVQPRSTDKSTAGINGLQSARSKKIETQATWADQENEWRRGPLVSPANASAGRRPGHGSGRTGKRSYAQ